VATVCPGGPGPAATVQDSRAEPDPAFGETSGSFGHRYRITAAGTVRNEGSAGISLSFRRPVTIIVDRSTTTLDVRIGELVGAGATSRWTATGYYLYYGDPRYWRPSLTAVVEAWGWSNYAYADCPR